MHAHIDGGLVTVCMRPQVIARGHRIAMLERFVEHCASAGARFARMGDVARELPQHGDRCARRAAGEDQPPAVVARGPGRSLAAARGEPSA